MVKRHAIYVDGEMTVRELTTIFTQAGYHLHVDGAGRMVVDPVPAIVRKDPPASNVVRMPTRARKVAR